MNQNFWLTSEDNVEIYVEKWFKESQEPKAIIQLAHGMVEHIKRYKGVAEFLLSQNIFVYGNDHRGHGRTGKKQGLMGYFADHKGFEKTTNDLVEITKKIKQEYPETPLFLLGHSMGSFLTRYYIQNHSDLVDGVILVGTGFYSKTNISLGKAIASRLPSKEKSPLMNKLAFGNFNRKITNKKTNFDWISRDEKVVKEYMADPDNGFIPTARFFFDLMTGLDAIHNHKRNKKIRHDIPILIISGTADPVGNYGKGVWETARLLDRAGLTNITTMLFENARHELLNELNKEEVYGVINSWIHSCLAK